MWNVVGSVTAVACKRSLVTASSESGRLQSFIQSHIRLSQWYKHDGWLGVKHKVTYLLTYTYDYSATGGSAWKQRIAPYRCHCEAVRANLEMRRSTSGDVIIMSSLCMSPEEQITTIGYFSFFHALCKICIIMDCDNKNHNTHTVDCDGM